MGWSLVPTSTATSVSAAGVTTSTVAPAGPISAGNDVLMVGIAYYNATVAGRAQGHITSVADTSGNTYTINAGAYYGLTGPGVEVTLWSAPITAGGGTSPTITVVGSISGAFAMIVAEFNSVAQTSGIGFPVWIDEAAVLTNSFFSAGPLVMTPPLTFPTELLVTVLAPVVSGSPVSDPALVPLPSFTLVGYSGASTTAEIAMAFSDSGTNMTPSVSWTWPGGGSSGINAFGLVLAGYVTLNPPGTPALYYSPQSW